MAIDKRTTLLIVEDDPGIARLQQQRLERVGYHVLLAANANEALAKVRNAPVDLLLLDQHLPDGLSGLELYQQIQQANLNIPAILVTGLSNDSLILKSFRAGVYDFVPKTPEYLDYLLPAVERVLKKHRTEAKLVESEAWLSCLIAVAKDSVLTVDEQQRIILFNPAAERMFGCPAAEALGQPVQRFLPGWTAQAEYLPALETEGVRTDGARFPVELAVSSLQTARGRFWKCLARDIRDRKRAQEERERLIREQCARLEAEAAHARMAAVAEENSRLNEQLRKTDQLKDEFLAMLAHELRNPLAPIRNALNVMRLSDPSQHAESLAIMDRQVHHLVRLVDDLLDVSRISQGKIQLQKERVDLAEVVARAVESSQPLLTAHRHQLTITLAEGPLTVEGDPVRLVQIVSNLLNNAAKYTPEGGRIELTAERLPSLPAPTKILQLRVRDNGMGILPEMLPHLFDMFAQSKYTLNHADGGLGIGLTLVRRLTELHNGTVQAISAGPGKGSEFIVRLPAAGEPLPDSSPAKDGPPMGVAVKRRVVVVDDNSDSLATLARLLRLLGNDVRTASTGTQALSLVEEFAPEVVLLDIGLPDIDGYEVARRLRAQARFQQLALVALTGFGSSEDRRQSEGAGFNVHMVKPVDLDALKQLLVNPEVLQRRN